MFRYLLITVLFIYGTVEGRDVMIFTVTDSDSTELTEVREDSRGGDHLFKKGGTIFVECKPIEENVAGTIRLKFCFYGERSGCATKVKTNNSTLKFELKIDKYNTFVGYGGRSYNMYHGVESYCTINEKYTSIIRLHWQPASPKVIEIGAQTVEAKTSGIITFRGKINDTKRYECTNLESVGSIHWEFCKDERYDSCTPAQSSSTNKLYQNIKLTEENIGTIVKCALLNPYNLMNAETLIMLYDENNIPGTTNWTLWISISIGVACAIIVSVVVYLKIKTKFRYRPPPHI